MDILIKSVRAATNGKKERLVKNNIKNELSNVIKEIQLYATEESFANDSLHMTEAQNSLCTVVEAILLHGLKDSLILRARRAMADIDEKPEPSFWAPLLIISHRQIIDQIANLAQITTEIGQCRAWVRTALNDSLVSSYFSLMRHDASVLKPYYNTYAYVRDSELLDISQRIVEGVEAAVDFTLPCNSSLLNTWQLQSLVLAGIWSPTLRACPVAAGMDIAQSLQSTSAINSETDSLSSAISFASHSSGIAPFLALSEDEALKIILAKHSSEKKSAHPSIEEEKNVDYIVKTNNIEPHGSKSPSETLLGNSLHRKSNWPFSEPFDSIDRSEEVEATSQAAMPEECPSKSTETSYHAVIESYNTLAGSTIKTPDFREILQNFEEERKSKNAQQSNHVKDEEVVNVPQTLNGIQCFEPPSLESCIGNIARERGMDFQNYECASCNQTLGITYSPNTCSYTGEYFCDKCMGVETAEIPARIIHNWDFNVYRVSIKAYTYLEEIKHLPLIDIKETNSYIYTVSDEMTKLQTLRIQLNFLRDYLHACREPIIEQLHQLVGGKDYMYEHIHKYSISDLVDIRSGLLIQHLEKVVNFGIEHVHSCWLCKQKGFICEKCNKSKVLYPFDLDIVYRCNACRAVYHNSCLNSTLPCPKCERKRKADLLLQE